MHTDEETSTLNQFVLFRIHGQRFLFFVATAFILIGIAGWFWRPLFWAYAVLAPVIVIGLWDLYFTNNTILNISAMSFGSLSAVAVRALNHGAKQGGFYHNTGEGGLSPYHEEAQADLVWEIGSGYFGCRTENSDFNEKRFRESAAKATVKMIEIKLSQGAKPGHGGVLPARKNTPEIASIRQVQPYTKVVSPAYHKAFFDAKGLLEFVRRLRELAEGKPVGFKPAIPGGAGRRLKHSFFAS